MVREGGYSREDQAFAWCKDIDPPKRLRVNAVSGPWQPPAGALAPAMAQLQLRWPIWANCCGEEVALAPRQKHRGPLRGRQALPRDVPSCSHLGLGLLYVSVSSRGFAGTLVPLVLPQKSWWEAQGCHDSCLYSFGPEFSPTGKHPSPLLVAFRNKLLTNSYQC